MTEWVNADSLGSPSETQWTDAEQLTPAGVPVSEMKTFARKTVDVFQNAKAKMFTDSLTAQHRARQLAAMPDYQKELAESTPWGKAGFIGAGKEFSDLGLGLQQRMQFALGNNEKAMELQNQYNEENALFKPLQKAHPISTMLGQMAPYIAPGIQISKASTALTNKFLRKMPNAKEMATGPLSQGAFTGGLEGAITGAVHPGMTAGQGAMFGLGGGAIGGGFGKVLGRTPTELTPDEEVLTKWAEQQGMKLQPGAETGIPYYQKLDAGFKGHPYTSRNVANVDRMNDEIITSKVFKEAGIEHIGSGETKQTPELLAANYQQLGQKYDDLVRQSYGEFDPELAESWAQHATDASRVAGINSVGGEIRTLPVLKKYMNRLQNMAVEDGYITGEKFQQLSSDMSEYIKANKNSTGNAKIGANALEKMRADLMATVERRLPPDLQGVWKDTNKKFAITSFLIENKVINPQTGDVNPIKLQNALMKPANQKAFMTNDQRSPFSGLFMPAKVGTYINSQPGADLKTAQGISRTLGTGMINNLPGLLYTKGAQAGLPTSIALGLYRAGYPHLTGLLGLGKGSQAAGIGLGASLGINLAEERNK